MENINLFKSRLIYYKKAIAILFLLLSFFNILLILSFYSFTDEINQHGYIDCITSLDIDYDAYYITHTMLLNKSVVNKKETDLMINNFNKNSFSAMLSEDKKYYKISAYKTILSKDVKDILKVYPNSDLRVSSQNGYSKIEGNINVELPKELTKKYGDSINMILKIKPVTNIKDSTGIINNRISTFSYKPGATNYINIVYKTPYILHLPFVDVKRVSQLIIYLLIVAFVVFIGYVFLMKSLLLYKDYKTGPIKMQDIEIGFNNNLPNQMNYSSHHGNSSLKDRFY